MDRAPPAEPRRTLGRHASVADRFILLRFLSQSPVAAPCVRAYVCRGRCLGAISKGERAEKGMLIYRAPLLFVRPLWTFCCRYAFFLVLAKMVGDLIGRLFFLDFCSFRDCVGLPQRRNRTQSDRLVLFVAPPFSPLYLAAPSSWLPPWRTVKFPFFSFFCRPGVLAW